MTTFDIGVLLGDGVGPEIVTATRDVLDAAMAKRAGTQISWIELPMGGDAIRDHGSSLPDLTKDRLADCHGWVMGPHDNLSYPLEHRESRNPSGELRHHFDLYANLRPAKSVGATTAVREGVDLQIVRENTEGFYSDRNLFWGSGELMPTEDVALTVGVFTRHAITRIAITAFELAAQRRGRLTVVHKGNVLPRTSGMYMTICRELAPQYPGVVLDDRLADAMAALLVRSPAEFDVVLTENMFGDILSDLASEVIGSMGFGASLNAGDTRAMAQAAHGAAPSLAGLDVVNPAGEIISGAMLFDWIGRRHDEADLVDAARDVEDAVFCVTRHAGGTRDAGGSMGTAAYVAALIAHVEGECPAEDGHERRSVTTGEKR